jgi:hypothetical protein
MCCDPHESRPARLDASPEWSFLLADASLICSFHLATFSASGWKITPAFPIPTFMPSTGSGLACCNLCLAMAVGPSMHLVNLAKMCIACSAQLLRSAVKKSSTNLAQHKNQRCIHYTLRGSAYSKWNAYLSTGRCSNLRATALINSPTRSQWCTLATAPKGSPKCLAVIVSPLCLNTTCAYCLC